MIIGDFVTLEGFQQEMLIWLEEVKKRCVPGGGWWDIQKNKPEIAGFYFKMFYDPRVHDWLLYDAGVYSSNKRYCSSKKTNHTFLIKGIDWTEETMKQEMARQYKEFLVKSKMVKLEGDFE